ncbi:M16 family metallopeptidase [Chloroflexota bacterium]
MYQKSTLANGLRIITATMPHICSVSIGIFIGIGSRYETETEAGVSHFIEHLLFKGTTKRPTARIISEAIEGLGGVLNGGTGKELAVYWCKVAQQHFTLALDVLVDMLLHSKFETEEIERERQVIIEEINMNKDSPSQQVDMLIDELLWPGHPLGRDVAGSRESVAAISREAILNYQSQYQPDSTVVSIAGNVQHEEAIAIVSQALGNWTSRRQRPSYSPYQEKLDRRLQIENRDTEQVHLCLALPGLSLFHPQRFILDLLNVILGEGMSSRLFVEIRDNLGLAYSIHSYVDHFLDSGSLSIHAGVEIKKLKTAITAILEQLSLLKEPIPAAELSKAKELSKGRLLLQMEDSRHVSGWLGGQEILTNRILTPNEVISIIDAITTEELKQVAQEIMMGDKLRLAIVGPVANDVPLDKLLKL